MKHFFHWATLNRKDKMDNKSLNFKEWTEQVKHAGKTFSGDSWWHYEPETGKYWAGNWKEMSPKDLYDACMSVCMDVRFNHPELFQ
jgi:hypothetical protein